MEHRIIITKVTSGYQYEIQRFNNGVLVSTNKSQVVKSIGGIHKLAKQLDAEIIKK